MSKAWTDKGEYQLLSGELAASDGRDFERLALPLIRIIWEDTIAPTPMGSFDRIGADQMVWADTEPFPLVVQYKGFKVSESEIGSSQINQCLKSIRSFREEGYKADVYLLVHNRIGADERFRRSIEEELRKLVTSGQVKRAELWNRQRFLREAFNKMLERVRSSIVLNHSTAQEYCILPDNYEPLKKVPLRKSELLFNPYRLMKKSTPTELVTDPSVELLRFDGNNIVLMIGEAGYGKTTAALRTFESEGRQIFYVPAATFSSVRKDFLQQCVKLDRLFAEFEDTDLPMVTRLSRPVIDYVLRDKKTPVVLILDGLDESAYFSNRGGLQLLFNQLREIRVPIILLVRSEFWHARVADFTTSFGEVVQKGEQRRRKIRFIELLPWTNKEIGIVARSYRDALTDSAQRARLNKLIEIIEDGTYKTFYGDIPTRPLFLRFILETVAERDIHRTGRAQLYYEWAQSKIERDIVQPMRWSTNGRAPIISNAESADMTIKLSFQAMMLAAFHMAERRDNNLELLPSCTIDEVLLSDERLKGIVDPMGLFLNSLLVPIPARFAHQGLQVRFAHRAYQEFFLALFFREHPEDLEHVKIPAAVMDHLRDLETENFAGSNTSEI